MAAPAKPLDDLLAFPLDGVQVIEASAGTGKTWTLAALYVRLVLGHGRPGKRGLLPPQILVMTFTEAATAELRGRIRDRLARAAEAFRSPPTASPDDEFIRALRAACPEPDWPRCALQLELAGQWMDEAAIHTIHGWSHRTLRQHAFASASLFRQEKLEDPAGERLAAVRDYWRREVYPLDVAALRVLARVADSPDALLEAIAPRRAAQARDPLAVAPRVPATLREALQPLREWDERCAAVEDAARAAWRAHLPALEAQLRDAMAGVLDARSFRSDLREGFLARMRLWADASPGDGGPLKPADYRRFSLGNLARRTRPGLTPPEDRCGVFALLDELSALREAGPPLDAVLGHALQGVERLYEERKAAGAAFDFPDLLQRLHHALHASDGRLAAAVRAQHPVALVDEFQDTDPWQYGALERIYLGGGGDRPGTLVMIGDPKQAIYGFRGADLATYLRARDAADGIHTLTANHRSTAAVVEAVNHVFTIADRPFDPLPYAAVTASRDDLQPLRAADGVDRGLTVWHADGVLGRAAFRSRMAESFATGIVGLLNDGVLSPPDVAILVADRTEAAAIRQALARRSVRSVYLSDRESVFGSTEAADLWQLLRAVSQPRLERHVRAAIATRSFGLAPDELAGLLADEPAMERQIERFVRWQFVWQRQGLLPMLYRLLHEQQIPARMLASPGGERRLTNLLHLGDLLQRASLGLQGEAALIRHFAERLREASGERGGDGGAAGGTEGGTDEAQMRLETDAGLVKVVTMHKSKGLQYPVVFLPFASSFRAPRRRRGGVDDVTEAGRPAEELRLLYVALTRAERAVFVGAAALKGEFPRGARSSRSALGRLLGCTPGSGLGERLQRWSGCARIGVAPLPAATAACYVPPVPAAAVARRAEAPRRGHSQPWGSHSFSSMARHASPPPGLPLAPSEADERFADAQADERRAPGSAVAGAAATASASAPAGAEWSAYPRGARYGDLLHRLLEEEMRERWPVLRAGGPDAAWQARIRAEADALGLLPAARELLPRWLAAIGDCPLDEAGSRLAQLDAGRAWPEMPFLITSRGATARGVDACIRAQVLAGRARDALQPRALDGLLGGSLDLVFEAGGRWYVLDYKSNQLEDYGRARLEEAILEHRYDLQYSLYLLALHRLLRARLADYDYDRHVGGAVYFFVRGIGAPGSGLFVDRPPRAMIEELDAAFRGERLDGAGE